MDIEDKIDFKEFKKTIKQYKAKEEEKVILNINVVLDLINKIDEQQLELEKKDRQIIKIREFLEKEQLELHDYDNNYDLSCEGKGRMYLVDELLEKYF